MKEPISLEFMRESAKKNGMTFNDESVIYVNASFDPHYNENCVKIIHYDTRSDYLKEDNFFLVKQYSLRDFGEENKDLLFNNVVNFAYQVMGKDLVNYMLEKRISLSMEVYI